MRMYTKAEQIIEQFIVPPLPKAAVLRLPTFVKPNKNNLATQYYFWNRQLSSDLQRAIKENKKIIAENQQLKEKQRELEEEKEKLKSERDKFREQLFKFAHRKPQERPKHEPVVRTKESYVRATPETIDEYRTATLNQCPFCDSELSETTDTYQRTIEDIPNQEQLKVKSIQYTIHRYYCKHCKKIISAKPRDVLPKCRLGINTLLNVLHSKYRLRLSQDLIRENLKTQYNLNIADGEITNLLEKGADVFQDKWQEIVETIKNSKTSNSDETSWKIGKDKSWLWAFVGNKSVRYTITETRGKGNAKEALGDYDGTVICDFYSAYNQFRKKQRCWVHLLRHARELCQEKQAPARIRIKNKLSRIYQDILLFRSSNAAQAERDAKAKQIKETLENLQTVCRINSGNENDKNLQKLLNLCRKFAGELVTCVRNFSVSPENNAAERAIRPAVLMRKISGGSRSQKGAKIHETNLSVMETLARQNKRQDIFPAMRKLVSDYLASGE